MPALANFCAPFTNCNRDSQCPFPGSFCRNRVCMCGETDPGICSNPSERCAARGLLYGPPPPVGATVHITSCRGANTGAIGGVISYCFTPACVPYAGTPCQSAPNSCGMRNSGTYQCGGSCSAVPPPDSACGTFPTGLFTAATCASADGNALDADGSPVTVRMFEGAGQIASGPAAPFFSIPLTFAPITDGIAQNHTLRAYAVDIPSGTNVQLLPDRIATCLPPVPAVTISATPSSVAYADSSTITWSATGAISCTGSGGTPAWVGNQPIAGSFLTGPLTATTTFTLTCTNDGGSTNAPTTVTVAPPPPPTATVVSCTDTDYCASGAGMSIKWQYDSPANPISAYQVQVLDSNGTVVFDTGKTAAVALESEHENDSAVAVYGQRPGLSRVFGLLTGLISSFIQ